MVQPVHEIGKKQTAQARELPAAAGVLEARQKEQEILALSLTLPASPAGDNGNLTVAGRAEGIVPPSSGLHRTHGRDLPLLYRCATATPGCAVGRGGTGSSSAGSRCGLRALEIQRFPTSPPGSAETNSHMF